MCPRPPSGLRPLRGRWPRAVCPSAPEWAPSVRAHKGLFTCVNPTPPMFNGERHTTQATPLVKTLSQLAATSEILSSDFFKAKNVCDDESDSDIVHARLGSPKVSKADVCFHFSWVLF